MLSSDTDTSIRPLPSTQSGAACVLTKTLSAVLPDAERMHHSYVNMVFDNDPTAEHERLAKLSNKQRRRISGGLPCKCLTASDIASVLPACIMFQQHYQHGK